MENDVERNEYVLADTGNIWVGSSRHNTGIPWTFGQVLNGYSQLFLNPLSPNIHLKFSRLISTRFLIRDWSLFDALKLLEEIILP